MINSVMETNLMTLPSEIQFQIAEHLRPFEHFYLASVCQQSWNIHGAAIEKHKEIIKSHGSHIFDYDTLVTMADVIQNSTIREKYTTGLTIMGSFWADYSELAGEGGGRLLQALAGTYRSELTCKDEERLLQVCSKAYRDDLLPVGFKSSDPDFPLIAQLLMSLPNLEILGVSFTLGVEQCFHDLMKAALKDGRQFRYLTQVYLSLLPSGYQNHYEIVHIIALLPSMRYIWANQPVSYGGRKMSLARGTSYVKELELYAAGVHLPHLAETLSIFAGLERFTYQQSMSEDLVTNCDARGILRALVDETSDSLLSIHFMGYSPIQRNARAPYISLKAFKKLQVLHCVWKFILPDRKDDLLHSIYNYYPAESFIENSGVISMVDPTSHPHLLTSYSLRDVIPDSLIVLQLSSCPFDETARGIIIELLSSRHPNLRRIEIDCMIDDELQELAEHAGIDLCSLKSRDVFWRHDTSCECGLHPPFKRWEKPRHKCRTRCPGRTSRYGIFMPPDDGVVDMLNGRPKQQGKPVWRRLFDFISLAGGFRPIFQTS